MKAAMTGRISRGRPVRNTAPVTARAATANRLTANPCASSNAAKPDTHADRKPGCGVWAIDCPIAASVPGCPCEIPCQKPRPGQACSTAIPARNKPSPARICRPRRGVRQA